MKKYAIIVAGGKGLRMGSELPKQFIPIGGKPVLMRTIEKFRQADREIHVIVVLPEEQQAFWQELCKQYDFTSPHRTVNGGTTRFHSVKNGLESIREEALIAVHDGVRPFVSIEVIRNAFEEAARCGAVVPVTDPVESIRRITENGRSTAVERSAYKLVQTPQVFSGRLLKNAYEQPYRSVYTDDASVVENFGHPVTLFPGNRENIKITTPFDLQLAEILLR